MRKTLLLTVGCLLGIWTFCYAQNNPIIPDYLSSGGVGNNLNTGTPQVWSLLKYGGSAPNLYTGTVSASIPLYTYQDEDFYVACRAELRFERLYAEYSGQ